MPDMQIALVSLAALAAFLVVALSGTFAIDTKRKRTLASRDVLTNW